MRITANGKPFVLDPGLSVAAFIRSRDLEPALVIVELNDEPLERARYEEVILSEGDRLELVRAVAGG